MTQRPDREPGGGEAPANPSERREPNRRPAEPAALALRMEDLTLWTAERVAKMSRDHKFTVGDRLLETCLEVTTLLVQASFLRDKLGLLAAASRGLVRARVLVRLAERLNLLSAAQRGHFAVESDTIGRMVGGWTRSQHSRNDESAGR